MKEKQAIYYLSCHLLPVEQCYSAMKKLYLALYYVCTKLRYYILPVEVSVVCKTDLIKFIYIYIVETNFKEENRTLDVSLV